MLNDFFNVIICIAGALRFVAQNLFSISKDCIKLDTPSSQLQSEPKKVKQKGVEKKHGLFTCWIEN